MSEEETSDDFLEYRLQTTKSDKCLSFKYLGFLYISEFKQPEFVSCSVHMREKTLQAHINIHWKSLRKKRRFTKEFAQTALKDPLGAILTKWKVK